MLDESEARAAAEALRRLVLAVEAGEVEAEPAAVAHVRGAIEALELVAGR